MEEREEPIHMPRQRLQSHSLHRSTRRSGCAAHSACRVAYTLAHGLCEKARSSRRTLRRLRSSSFPGKPSYKKCLLHVGDAEADILLDVRAEEGVEAARRADAEAQALSRASARSTSAAAKWPASEKIFIYAHIPAAASQSSSASGGRSSEGTLEDKCARRLEGRGRVEGCLLQRRRISPRPKRCDGRRAEVCSGRLENCS